MSGRKRKTMRLHELTERGRGATELMNLKRERQILIPKH